MCSAAEKGAGQARLVRGWLRPSSKPELTCGMMRSSLMYMRLSTDTPRSSGNCCRHFSRNCAIESPFLHCATRKGISTRLLPSPTTSTEGTAHGHHLPMPTSVPVRIRDFNVLLFHVFLLLQPFTPQLVSHLALLFFPFAIRQEMRVYCRVLAQLGFLRRSVDCCYASVSR